MAQEGTAPAALASVDDLVRGIQSQDDIERTAAWRGAGALGAPAIAPLADLASHESMEVARAAQRGLWQIVRHCGRPGADSERDAVGAALLTVLADLPATTLKRDVIWMVSEIGGDACVAPLAGLLADADMRDDACLVLERIPGNASLEALRAAIDTCPDDFKPHVAESLRRRGESVPGISSAKMTPVKSTAVEPL